MYSYILSTIQEFTLGVKVFESISNLVPQSELKILSGIGRIYLQVRNENNIIHFTEENI